MLPLDGAGAAADVPITLVINGKPVPLNFCSRSCRTADATLTGGEHVDVVADTPSGGMAGFDLRTLPASQGTTMLQRVQDRMHRLQTFRSDEELRPAIAPAETMYAFQAPDLRQMDINNGYHTVFFGSTRYTRNDATGSGWQAEDAGLSLPVPSFVWDERPSDAGAVATHVLGAENLDGVDTQVLAFFENLGQYPFWFRLWADADGLVRKAEMRGHFMDEHYTDFDAPFTIEPPKSVKRPAPLRDHDRTEP